MSEFKFACPVCGQHITADSSTSGTQLDCPTCYRRIIVPQAPAAGETKLILSASQVGKPRPTSVTAAPMTSRSRSSSLRSWLPALGLVLVLGACGAALVRWHGTWFKRWEDPAQAASNVPLKQTAWVRPRETFPVPTNTSWTLDLAKAVIPDEAAAGSVHSRGFFCERAVLQGGNLSLRQGRNGPSEASFGISLAARLGEELSGKTIEIPPTRLPPLPKVTLRWKDDQDQNMTEHYPAGYALKIAFGQAHSNRMPARIFLALPDDAKSFVAGTFTAEIRKPQPPKPRAPRTPGNPTAAR